MSAIKQQSSQQHNTERHNGPQRGAAPHPGTNSTPQHTAHSTERRRPTPRDTKAGGGGGGSSHQGAANSQAGSTKEATAHREPRSGRPTKQTTHSAEAQGTRFRKPEKARDNGRTQRRRKKKGGGDRAAATKTAGHRGGGAATTREQPTARRETQTRGERTESREAGGQQNKQHTAPRPAAHGAGNQRAPETTRRQKEKERRKKEKQRHRAAATRPARHKRGGGGGGNHQGAANGRAEDTNEVRAHEERGSRRLTEQTTHSAKAQGTRGRKPKKVRDNEGAEGRKKREKKTTGRGRRRKGKQGAKAQGSPGRKPKKARDKEGARKTTKQEEKKRTERGATPAWRGPSKAERRSGPRKKVRRTRTRPGGRPARPVQDGRAHAHTHGTLAWHPPTRKGRCRISHETAPVHRPSPPLNDRRYGKPDASVTGSTHAKPRQHTQPKTDAGGTRQGQPHRGAPNGYDAERAQRPCLGGVQRQAQ